MGIRPEPPNPDLAKHMHMLLSVMLADREAIVAYELARSRVTKEFNATRLQHCKDRLASCEKQIVEAMPEILGRLEFSEDLLRRLLSTEINKILKEASEWMQNKQ